jgi:hypothetical protein
VLGAPIEGAGVPVSNEVATGRDINSSRSKTTRSFSGIEDRIESSPFIPAIRQATGDVACEYWLVNIDDGCKGSESRAHTPEKCAREGHRSHSSHRFVNKRHFVSHVP